MTTYRTAKLESLPNGDRVPLRNRLRNIAENTAEDVRPFYTSVMGDILTHFGETRP